MLVKDVMTDAPLTVSPQTGVKEARTRLAHAGITSAPVVDECRRLCGVVSEADLIRGVIGDDPRAHERPIAIRPFTVPRTVEDVYTRPPVTVRPEDDVATAVELMSANGFKSLPVVDDTDGLVGVLSRSDVLRALARDDLSIADDIRRVFTDLGRGGWTVQVVDGVVDISGPANVPERSLATTVARTVAGVVEVQVR